MSPSRLLLLAGAAWSALSVSALAQTTPPSQTPATGPVTEVDEIVVTGAPYGVTRRATTLAVEVLDQEALDSAPPSTLGDVLNGMPGVRTTAFSAGASRPVIRGLAGPRVLVLTNGVGLIDASGLSPDHQVAADPGDATRIEVLRGPSALAYGGTAIGGVVNVIDNRIPDTAPEGGFEGHIGTQFTTADDGYAVSGGFAASAGPFVVTLEGHRREAGDYSIPVPAESRRQVESEGEVYEDTGDTTLANSFSNVTVYGGGLTWIGSDGFVGLSVRRTESNYGVPGHSHEHEHEEGEEEEHHEEAVHIDLEQTRYDLRGEWAMDLGPFERVRFSGGYADYTHAEIEGGEVGTRFLSDGWEGRVELIQAPRSGWRGAVGVQALRRDFDAQGDEAYVPQTQITETGLYTMQRVDLGRFGFEGGLRVDSRELDSVAGQRDFTNVSASAGLFYRPDSNWFLGVSLARNGRAPTEAELFAAGPHAATRAFEQGDANLDSETVVSLEGTVHYDNGPWTADLHVYASEYDGFIDLVPTGAEEDGFAVYQYTQTGASFRGFEAQAGYRVWDGGETRNLTIEAAGDLVRGETDLGAPARIPPWSVTGRGVLRWDGWTTRVELRHVADQDRVADLELPTDGYDTVNTFVSWTPDPEAGLTFYVEGRNLNDAEIREHASFLKDLAPSQGRNIRVGATYRF